MAFPLEFSLCRTERLQAMLNEKSKGREITVAAPATPLHGYKRG